MHASRSGLRRHLHHRNVLSRYTGYDANITRGMLRASPPGTPIMDIRSFSYRVMPGSRSGMRVSRAPCPLGFLGGLAVEQHWTGSGDAGNLRAPVCHPYPVPEIRRDRLPLASE